MSELAKCTICDTWLECTEVLDGLFMCDRHAKEFEKNPEEKFNRDYRNEPPPE